MENIWSVLITAITVLSGTSAFRYYEQIATKIIYTGPIDRFYNYEFGKLEYRSLYWATSLHEHMHWTGHKDRLNREGITMSGFFGSNTYAFEELVAEMGAAFLCMRLGVKHDSLLDNHAAYLQNWVKGLKEDPKALMKAASLASKGMNYILKGCEDTDAE